MTMITCPLCIQHGVEKQCKNLKRHLQEAHRSELDQLFSYSPQARQAFEQATSEQLAEMLSQQPPPQPPETPPQEEQSEQPKTEQPQDVEAAVISALKKVDFEGIARRVAREEFSSEINKLAAQGQQQGEQPQQTGGDQGNLQQTMIAALAQKLLGGDSGGSLEKMIAQQNQIASLVQSFMAPQQQARMDAFKEINEVIKLSRGIGASPEQTGEVIGNITGKESSE